MRPDAGAFLTGANLPWLRYGGDFGASAWSPDGGVSRPDQAEALDGILGRAAARGVTLIRWFTLCDGRAGVALDADGRPTGLDAHVRRDLDTAFAILERHGVRALFVLFDFLLARPGRAVQGVRLFGRRRWLADRNLRGRLLERVVAPLVAHAAGAPGLLGWDVINEPEWATLGAGEWRPWRAVARGAMRGFLSEAVPLVRDAGRAPVTVGLASVRGLGLVRDLGLDFHQVHWYDHVDHASTLTRQVEAYGLHTPLLLGEFPTMSSGQPPTAIVSSARRAGYAGALAWSLCAEDAFSSEDGCYEALGAGLAP